MNLSNFSMIGIIEAEIIKHDTLLELNQRSSGGIRNIRKGVYPRSQFGYTNYQIDPRPDVLKFGIWKNPNTKNTLLGGINLNYLSTNQILRLKKASKQIFSRSTLRSRYRYAKRKIPDIVQYYRTYDKDYIYSNQPDEFKSFDYRDTKEPDTKDVEMRNQADIERVADLSQETNPEVDPNAHVEKDREAWTAKRRLYEPDTGRRTEPEQNIDDNKTLARKEKLNKYKSQRAEIKQLEKDADLERLAMAIKHDSDEAIDQYAEPNAELPKKDELDKHESVDYHYSSNLGFTWKSKPSYIKYHTLDNFNVIKELCPGKTMVIYDTISKQIVIDAVPNQIFILEHTGWDYDHTILIEKSENELVFSSELGQSTMIDAISHMDYSKIAMVLLE